MRLNYPRFLRCCALAAFLAFAGSPLSAEGRALRLAIALEPSSLDLHRYSTYQHALIARLFAGTLLDRDEKGEIVGAAAESFRQVSSTEWLFRLRPGIRFQNGDPLTSEDVQYSLERIANVNKKDFATIKRVEVLGTLEFKIVTSVPDPLLPSRLVPLGFIVSKRAILKAGGPERYFATGKIDGFGPYRLAAWERGKYIELLANPSYYKGKPSISALLFLFEPRGERRVAMLLSGEADIISDIPAIATLEIEKSGVATVVKSETGQYLFGNLRIAGPDSPLADPRVRRALNLAVDRQRLIRLVELGNGLPIPTIFVRQAFGYLGLEPYAFDPTEARRLLREAGYGKGLSLSMLVASDLQDLAAAIAKELEDVGISITLHAVNRDEGIADWLVAGTRNEDIFLLNPIDPMIDVGYHVETLIARYPRQKLPLIASLDELYQKSCETTSISERSALLQRIQRRLYDESLYLFLWQRLSLYGVSTRIQGFTPYIDGMIRLEGVQFDDHP